MKLQITGINGQQESIEGNLLSTIQLEIDCLIRYKISIRETGIRQTNFGSEPIDNSKDHESNNSSVVKLDEKYISFYNDGKRLPKKHLWVRTKDELVISNPKLGRFFRPSVTGNDYAKDTLGANGFGLFTTLFRVGAPRYTITSTENGKLIVLKFNYFEDEDYTNEMNIDNNFTMEMFETTCSSMSVDMIEIEKNSNLLPTSSGINIITEIFEDTNLIPDMYSIQEFNNRRFAQVKNFLVNVKDLVKNKDYSNRKTYFRWFKDDKKQLISEISDLPLIDTFSVTKLENGIEKSSDWELRVIDKLHKDYDSVDHKYFETSLGDNFEHRIPGINDDHSTIFVYNEIGILIQESLLSAFLGKGVNYDNHRYQQFILIKKKGEYELKKALGRIKSEGFTDENFKMNLSSKVSKVISDKKCYSKLLEFKGKGEDAIAEQVVKQLTSDDIQGEVSRMRLEKVDSVFQDDELKVYTNYQGPQYYSKGIEIDKFLKDKVMFEFQNGRADTDHLYKVKSQLLDVCADGVEFPNLEVLIWSVECLKNNESKYFNSLKESVQRVDWTNKGKFRKIIMVTNNQLLGIDKFDKIDDWTINIDEELNS